MSITNPSHFGERLRWCMTMAGVKTNKDLAAKLKVTEGTIRNLLNSPKPHRNELFLAKIADSLGITKEFLLRGDLRPNASAPYVAENVIPYQVPPPPLDQALMESAILAVLQLLEARSLKLSPERTLAGILAVYEAARAQGREAVTDADVTPIVRLLMA